MGHVLVILLLFLSLKPTFAQEKDYPLLAAVHDGDVWLYGFAGEPLRITDGTAARYANLVWSPDGNYLAFVALDESFRASLWLYHLANHSLTLVDHDVPAGLPASFTDDMTLLFFNDVDPPGSDSGNPMEISAFDVKGGTPTMTIATVDLGEGCGGGSSFAGDWRYWDETEALGGFHSVLEYTAHGLLYSTDCGYRTVLLDLETGEQTSLGHITRVALSPDRETLAGIRYQPGSRRDDRLVTVNLETLATTLWETGEIPDQVIWATPSALLFSTRQMTDRTAVSSPEALERINAVLGSSAQTNTWQVSIRRLDLETNEDAEVYRADAYAIGRLGVARDGSTLFSQVSNAEHWLNEIGEGRLDPSDPQRFLQSVDLIPVQLFALITGNEQGMLLGEGLLKARLSPAQ